MASRPEGAPPIGRRQGADRAPHNRFGSFGLRFRLGAIAPAVAEPRLGANVAGLAIDVAHAQGAATADRQPPSIGTWGWVAPPSRVV